MWRCLSCVGVAAGNASRASVSQRGTLLLVRLPQVALQLLVVLLLLPLVVGHEGRQGPAQR